MSNNDYPHHNPGIIDILNRNRIFPHLHNSYATIGGVKVVGHEQKGWDIIFKLEDGTTHSIDRFDALVCTVHHPWLEKMYEKREKK